jgi:hypothetical protein
MGLNGSWKKRTDGNAGNADATTHPALPRCSSRGRGAAPRGTPPEQPRRATAQARRQQASRPTYNLTGYPPAVREGYIDGCESAKKTQYARKDAKRMSGDAQYEMGWNDGFSICSAKK